MSPDARATLAALEAVGSAPTLLAGVEVMDALVAAARADGPEAAPHLAAALEARHDDLTAIAAVHAAAAAGTATALQLVVPLLTTGAPHLREHAAWALGRSPRVFAAVPALQDLADAGGLAGTLAAATLEAWGLATDPADADEPEEPADVAEPHDADPEPHDADHHGAPPGPPGPPGPGLTVAQLYLHADLDGSLRHAGQGDTGGIATLLVHLGDALLAEGTATRILTLSRGRPGERRDPDDLGTPGHHYPSIPLPGPVRHAADAWPLRGAARRGLRRVLRAAGRVDVLHLRMADVGSWAAAEVARELGIPTVLTLAPDPHALVAAREAHLRRGGRRGAPRVPDPPAARPRGAGRPPRRVPAPRSRARPPRPAPPRPRRRPPRHRRARGHRPGAPGAGRPRGGGRADTAAALADLDTLLAALPDERRDLPLAITVGRLHRVKGMATLVETWASDPALAARCNLLVVGGTSRAPTSASSSAASTPPSRAPPARAAGSCWRGTGRTGSSRPGWPRSAPAGPGWPRPRASTFRRA